MSTPDDLQKIFTAASSAVLQAYNSSNSQAGGNATPSQLIVAINQFFIIYEKVGSKQPEDCLGFFEEGLKQSEKAVYGPEIKAMMAKYFKKWATLH